MKTEDEIHTEAVQLLRERAAKQREMRKLAADILVIEDAVVKLDAERTDKIAT